MQLLGWYFDWHFFECAYEWNIDKHQSKRDLKGKRLLSLLSTCVWSLHAISYKTINVDEFSLNRFCKSNKRYSAKENLHNIKI